MSSYQFLLLKLFIYFLGHYYAAQFGIQWCRVQIEKSERHEEAFFVDIGRRKVIHPSMMFHELPDRY